MATLVLNRAKRIVAMESDLNLNVQRPQKAVKFGGSSLPNLQIFARS